MERTPLASGGTRALILWALRIAAAALLAAGGSAGLCLAAESTRFVPAQFVCGHNAALTLVPLFFGLWALLEFALPALLALRKK
jgi:hypothetical protein